MNTNYSNTNHPNLFKLGKYFCSTLLSLVLGQLILLPICSTQLFAASKASSTNRSWKEYFRREKRASDNDKPSRFDRAKSRESSESSSGSASGNTNPEGLIDLVDSPTTNILDYGAYRLNFRLYSAGGVQSHLGFGVFRRLNLGASWDNEKIIGSETPATNAPTLYVKLRAYDGGQILPSFALGYDGQGRFFNRTVDQYDERERGLFGVFSRELFFPGLEGHGGVNIAQFKEGLVFGFIGLSYVFEERLAVFTEYDNIRVGPNNRWNAGVRIFPIPSLSIDFAFRRIASNQDKERIVRINYVGSF